MPAPNRGISRHFRRHPHGNASSSPGDRHLPAARRPLDHPRSPSRPPVKTTQPRATTPTSRFDMVLTTPKRPPDATPRPLDHRQRPPAVVSRRPDHAHRPSRAPSRCSRPSPITPTRPLQGHSWPRSHLPTAIPRALDHAERPVEAPPRLQVISIAPPEPLPNALDRRDRAHEPDTRCFRARRSPARGPSAPTSGLDPTPMGSSEGHQRFRTHLTGFLPKALATSHAPSRALFRPYERPPKPSGATSQGIAARRPTPRPPSTTLPRSIQPLAKPIDAHQRPRAHPQRLPRRPRTLSMASLRPT